MRSFSHISAATVDQACSLLRKYKGKAVLNAGGTDLLLTLKGEHLFEYPEAVIDIKTIDGLDSISENEDGLKIGALAKLSAITRSPLVRNGYGALAEAALTVATPQIRNAGTIGGNLCQDVRCWYYRYPRHIGGPMTCLRKGKGPCLAVAGDNRYHAIIGGKKCFAVCPSDTAVALAAMDGKIRIASASGERTIPVTGFFSPLGNGLKSGEMVISVEVPKIKGTAKQTFLKFTLRKPVDFAIVSVASVILQDKGVCVDGRIALGAVAPGPVRAEKAEETLKGKPITPELAAEAAEQALADAKPLSMNAYKVEIAKTLVKRAVLTGL
ncbi:MAG: xanthine dehydrogenase family protein subunit M [Desulfobacterales bacterium]|nr:xanthine dehydrogenase family protein subunit M [Desulfobacterales bacterium]